MFAGVVSGEVLEPVDETGVVHRLAGVTVADGATLEVRTSSGWVTGHYRRHVHPESGSIAFEMHVLRRGDDGEHLTVFLPPDSLFRWPEA